MNNTDLFRFDFVDRENQKLLIQNLFENKTESNILWLNGPHGVGKSFFLKNMSNFTSCPEKIYVELKAEDKEQNCLLDLLVSIGEKVRYPFIKFFRENYLEVVNIVKSAVVFTTKQITKIDLSNLINSMYDSTRLFVLSKNQQKEKQNATRMICSYINELLDQKDILVVLDNFSLCDIKSLNIIIDIILYYYKNEQSEHKIFFILSTTSNENNNYISNAIKEKLPVCPCYIDNFKDSKYFSNILNRIFTFSKADIERIFAFCEGNPQKLRDFIHKLFDNNGIHLSSKHKPHIDLEVVNSIIRSGTTDLVIKELAPTERIIISVIVLFGKVMTIDFLTDISLFVISNFHFHLNINLENISTSLLNLIYNETIELFRYNNQDYVKIEHDLKFYNIQSQLNDDPFHELINESIYSFLTRTGKKYISDIFTQTDLNDSIAYHSYKSKVSNWQSLNYCVGKTKYELCLFGEASLVFDRITDYIDAMSFEEQYIIADCYYQSGQYPKCRKIISSLYYTKRNLFNYNAYFLYARVEGILLNKEFALGILKQALALEETNEVKQLQIKCIRQQLLTNIKDRRIEAKQIFDDIKNYSPQSVKSSYEYSNFLTSTVEFYRGNEAQIDLEESKRIALNYNNDLLLAEISFNMGFDDFWEGHLESAKKNFEDSYNIFSHVRQHELAYPLNNLASYYMIKNDLDSAISCLNEAILWAQSYYAKTVIKTQLMICYGLLCDNYSLTLAEEIKEQMAENDLDNDVSAYIKYHYNLGFVYKQMGRTMDSNQEFYYATKKATSLIPSNLPHTWIYELDARLGTWVNDNLSKYTNYINKMFDPWLLTINHY